MKIIITLLLFTDLTVFVNVSDVEGGQNPHLAVSMASAAGAAFQMNSVHAAI